MKKTVFFLILMFSAITIAQELRTPNAYFSYIGVEKERICKSIWNYNLTLVANRKNNNYSGELKKSLEADINIALEKIALLKNGFNGDLEYKNNFLEYLNICQKQIALHFENISGLKELNNQTYEAMEKYMLERNFINKNIKYQSEILNQNQLDFAKKYKLNFKESKNELSNKMKIAVEVFDNHSALYLIYFKVYVTEAHLRNAIKDKKIDEIKSISAELLNYGNEGLMKLKNIKSYQNDLSLVNATEVTINFAIKQTEDFVPKVLNYLSENEKFTAFKNSVNSDKNPETVAEFNKMVTKKNVMTQDYNNLNKKFDSERLNVYNNWNIVGENFISKYVEEY